MCFMFLLKVTMQPLRRPYTVRRPLQDVCRPLKLIKFQVCFTDLVLRQTTVSVQYWYTSSLKIPLVMKGSEKGSKLFPELLPVGNRSTLQTRVFQV